MACVTWVTNTGGTFSLPFPTMVHKPGPGPTIHIVHAIPGDHGRATMRIRTLPLLAAGAARAAQEWSVLVNADRAVTDEGH